jgi:hypothetical protein
MDPPYKNRMWLYIAIAIVVLWGYWYVRVRPRTQDSLAAKDLVAEMQSRAQLAVNDAKIEFNADLDYSPDSIETVDSILAQIHNAHVATPLSDAELNRSALKWGGYLGEVIKRVRAAEWRLNSDVGGEASLPIVYEDNSESFPVRWCYKRIVNGDEDNVWHKFTILVTNRDSDLGDPISFAARGEDGDIEVEEPSDLHEPK